VSAETPTEIADGVENDAWNQGARGSLTGSFSRIRVGGGREDIGNR
jgi:hypothetical protein